MKNLAKLFCFIAVVAVMALVSGCATASSIGGTADPQGLITGTSAVSPILEGRREIASYNVIIGLFTSGYGDYANTVETVLSGGLHVFTVTRWYVVFSKTTAYVRQD